MQTSQAPTPLRHSLFLHRNIEVERHVYAADSLAKSRLLYIAEILPKASVNELGALHGTYMRLCRDAPGMQQRDQEEKHIAVCEGKRHDMWVVIRR